MIELTKKEKNKLVKLFGEEFANFLTISYGDNKFLYNINESIYFKEYNTYAPTFYYDYTIVEKDNWALISYKNYKTIELWWFICRFNQIYDMTETPKTGTIIKIPTKEFINMILNTMRQ